MADVTINDPLDFSTVIGEYVTSEDNHADTFNLRLDRIVNNQAYLKQGVDSNISDISTLDGRITTNANDISTNIADINTLEGQNLDGRITSNDSDILDIEDGTTVVNNAANLNGEALEVLVEGSTSITAGNLDAISLSAGGLCKYIVSVYCDDTVVVDSITTNKAYYYIAKYPGSSGPDTLYIDNDTVVDGLFYYKVWIIR